MMFYRARVENMLLFCGKALYETAPFELTERADVGILPELVCRNERINRNAAAAAGSMDSGRACANQVAERSSREGGAKDGNR